MAYQDMRARLRGAVPKLSFAASGQFVNDAWKFVRESSLWSFNLLETSWITPPPITTGTVTITQGSAALQFDATAVAAINAAQLASPYSLITSRQFRGGNVAGLSGIYNIIQYDATTGAATLDRIMGDPGGTGVAYTIYQTYYTPNDVNGTPIPDFLTWLSVRNMQMFLDLELYRTKSWVDARDPQRSWYQFPTHVIPWGPDLRGQGTPYPSSSLGVPLYELWGTAITPFTYQCYGLRRGLPLVNPTDTLPFQIGEDLVLEMAKYYAYQWAESNKDIVPRSQGPDFRFLMQQAYALYHKLLVQYKRQDKELIDNFWALREPDLASHAFGYYNTIANVAGPYTQ